VAFVVSVKKDGAAAMVAELRQILDDLGVAEGVKVDEM
jgi:hypothetical protein